MRKLGLVLEFRSRWHVKVQLWMPPFSDITGCDCVAVFDASGDARQLNRGSRPLLMEDSTAAEHCRRPEQVVGDSHGQVGRPIPQSHQ
jgi:hypothetical protein